MKALNRSGQKNKRTGQATLEFALVALLFMGLLFVIIDLGMLFYVNLTMQHAVREGTRYAVTGEVGSATNWRTALTDKIKEQSIGLYDKNRLPNKEPVIKSFDCESATFSNITTTLLTNDFVASKCIEVRLTYQWRLITPILRPFFTGGNYTFTVRSTMKTEPPQN